MNSLVTGKLFVEHFSGTVVTGCEDGALHLVANVDDVVVVSLTKVGNLEGPS